jgi:hypothetical protein
MNGLCAVLLLHALVLFQTEVSTLFLNTAATSV